MPVQRLARCAICLLISAERASGFMVRRLSGRSSSFTFAMSLRPAAMSATRSPLSPVTASEVAFSRAC